MTNKKIFISHRSVDVMVASIIKELLIGIGVKNDDIFCSSIPGYDVKYVIGEDVYDAISQSKIDIIVFSSDYYESAYCRNEEGIIWYKNKKDKGCKIIPIALPEINKDNLLGFIDEQHILRKLDSKTDIATIIDVVSENLAIKLPTQAVIQTIIERKIAEYLNYISTREKKDIFVTSELMQKVNDVNARAVLYYSIETKRTEFSVQNVESWIADCEYHDIDVLRGFNLLSELKYGAAKNNRFSIDLTFFDNMSKHSAEIKFVLKRSLASKRYFSRDTFVSMWYLGELSELQKLFIAFLVETKLYVFDERLKKRIVEWENDCCIHSKLQNLDFINMFIERGLISPSKENGTLVLAKSFYEYLHNGFAEHITLKKIKDNYKLKHIIDENHRND